MASFNTREYAYCVVFIRIGAGVQLIAGWKNVYSHTQNGHTDQNCYYVWNGGGQRCFPGGAVNMSETPATAAVREFREETNVDLTTIAHLPIVFTRNEDRATDRVMTYYGVFVEITDPAVFAAIEQLASTAIGDEAVTDGELFTTEVLTLGGAPHQGLFGPTVTSIGAPTSQTPPWVTDQLNGICGTDFRSGSGNQIVPPLRSGTVQQLVLRRMLMSGDWFDTIANQVPPRR